MKILRWSLVVALFGVGIGAVIVSTGTLEGTRAATTDLITATAARADVERIRGGDRHRDRGRHLQPRLRGRPDRRLGAGHDVRSDMGRRRCPGRGR